MSVAFVTPAESKYIQPSRVNCPDPKLKSVDVGTVSPVPDPDVVVLKDEPPNLLCVVESAPVLTNVAVRP